MPSIPESLVRLVQALVEDDGLREWFESLAMFSVPERAGEFNAIATRIRAGGDHTELAHATALLGAPGVYEAVRTAVAELTK